MTSQEKRQYRDGGYGWIVVMSAFFVSFITDGITFSFGILLVDMIEVFQSDRGQTAFVGSMITGLMHIIGPVAGSLCDSYGYRAVVVTGSLVSSAGLLASMFVSELSPLYVTYGLLCGTGFGLMYLPACVCVIHNFNKKRTLANGVAVCGSGVGMFVFNVLTRHLLDTYGLKGTFLILSGVCLNGVVLALLLSDPEQVPEHEARELVDVSKLELVSEESMKTDQLEQDQNNVNCSDSLKQLQDHDDNQTYSTADDIGTGLANKSDARFETVNDNYESNLGTNDEAKELMPDTNQTTTEEPTLRRKVLKAFLEMWDLSLMKNFNFLAYLICCFLLNFAFIIPIHLLPDEAESLQMSKQEGAWLVSAMGISNTAGRIIMGWLGDRKIVNRFAMFVCCIVLCGVFTGLSPLLITFGTKLAYACTYGLLIGGFVTLQAVVLADMVGLDNLLRAFGLVMFAIGVSGAVGAPVGGWLFDVTGKYDVTFIIAGILFVLSGVIIILPNLCKRFKQKDNKSFDET